MQKGLKELQVMKVGFAWGILLRYAILEREKGTKGYGLAVGSGEDMIFWRWMIGSEGGYG